MPAQKCPIITVSDRAQLTLILKKVFLKISGTFNKLPSFSEILVGGSRNQEGISRKFRILQPGFLENQGI
jgi:hypothetical protein